MRTRACAGRAALATLTLPRLWTQNAAEALRLLPARAEVRGDLDDHVGLGQVDGGVAHLPIRVKGGVRVRVRVRVRIEVEVRVRVRVGGHDG